MKQDPTTLEKLIADIKSNLNVVNAALIQAEDYSIEQIDELVELKEYIQKKQGRLTLMEIEGILDELRNLRQVK